MSFNLSTKALRGLLCLEYICSMVVDQQLVTHLAHLSRLHLDPEKMDQMIQDMQALVGFVEQLNALDTTGVAPLMHMGESCNVLRADEIAGSIAAETALKNAPDADASFFKVPKVIRK